MSDRILIYVAGNPDAYPLEYYDPSTETYQGVIPELLAQFSAQSRYDVLYYAPQEEDQREHLAENLQVDLLSGYTQGDEIPGGCRTVRLFQTVYEGQEVSYYICFTQAAPHDLPDELSAFFAAVPQEAVSGILMEASEPTPPPAGLYVAAGALALGAAILAAALILTVRRYRKLLRLAREDLESDETTGLGNLDYLQRYYKQIVNDKNRVLYHMICFYVDTDRLSQMGGSQARDEILRCCAMVLQEFAADTDILARVSEHGFVLLKLSANMEQTEACISAILQKIRTHPQTDGKSPDVYISAGVYPLREGDRDLQEMVFNASQAARSACQAHEDFLVFSDEARKKLQTEQTLRLAVDRALEHHEFQLYIQFYVDVHTHRIVGGEALSRWIHPEKGLLCPHVFVPVLEREGMIHKLDYYCLNSACVFLQKLEDQGVRNFFLSCNFSRETFSAADFPERCMEILERYRFPRELLIFELTESASVKDPAQIRENMLALKKYGVKVALDDFGEGFTSFSDLQQYPVDGIKLDKRLIDNITTKNGIAILRAMVQVGHELGITILAEGVEQESQVLALRQIHCDVIQGFRFYAPMPETECMEKVLRQFSGVC